MVIRNRIWHEFLLAKTHVKCIQRYTDRRRKWNRAFDLTIGIIAAVGTITIPVKIKDVHPFPAISIALVALASLIKALVPHYFQSEEELATLDSLSDFYLKYQSKLEILMYRVDKKQIDEDTAVKDFYKLKEIESDKESTMNRLIRNLSEKEKKFLEQDTDEYAHLIFDFQEQSNHQDKNDN